MKTLVLEDKFVVVIVVVNNDEAAIIDFSVYKTSNN